jgi:hypothetical protein
MGSVILRRNMITPRGGRAKKTSDDARQGVMYATESHFGLFPRRDERSAVEALAVGLRAFDVY